jgi:Protein of unknown function (DUF2795)
VSDAAQRLRHVLSGQPFPAHRWELISGAEHYGADARTRQELQSLPAKQYASLAEVLWALERRPCLAEHGIEVRDYVIHGTRS